jgi:hypothetical protein
MDLDNRDRLHASLCDAVDALDLLPAAVCPGGFVPLVLRVPLRTRLALLRPLARRFAWHAAGDGLDGDSLCVYVIADRAQMRNQLDDLATWLPRRSPISALRPIRDWQAVTAARGVEPIATNATRRGDQVLVAVTLMTSRNEAIAATIVEGFCRWVGALGGQVDARHPPCWLSISVPESQYQELSRFPFIRQARSQRPVNILRRVEIAVGS